eukprot:9979745-Alexandrium_andersonii.AAC.1
MALFLVMTTIALCQWGMRPRPSAAARRRLACAARRAGARIAAPRRHRGPCSFLGRLLFNIGYTLAAGLRWLG